MAMGRKSGARQEDKILALIDFKNLCGKEFEKFRALLTHKDFPSDLKKQNEAATIIRAMVFKIRAARVDHMQTTEEILASLQELLNQFGGGIERQSVNLVVSGPNDGPVETVIRVIYDDKKGVDDGE